MQSKEWEENEKKRKEVFEMLGLIKAEKEESKKRELFGLQKKKKQKKTMSMKMFLMLKMMTAAIESLTSHHLFLWLKATVNSITVNKELFDDDDDDLILMDRWWECCCWNERKFIFFIQILFTQTVV